MKYQKRSIASRFYSFVGKAFSFGLFVFITFTCIGIGIKAEKEGVTFRQACAKLFFGEQKPVETYSGERPPPPSLKEIAEKQKAEKWQAAEDRWGINRPTPPTQLTQGNGTAKPAKPAAYSAPAGKTTSDEAGICPSCNRFHLKSVSCASDAAFASTLVKEPAKQKYKQPARTKKNKKTVTDTTPTQKEFVSIVTWQAADNTPGAGRTVGARKFGDINNVSDLERQAAQNVGNLKSLKELQDATAAVRGGN